MKSDHLFPLLILAGGASSRMGEPKGLLQIKNASFLEWQIKRFMAAGGKTVNVVTGCDTPKYQNYFRNISFPIVVNFFHNPDWEEGQFSSLICGLKNISDQAPSPIFILPIDTPAPKSDIWQNLAKSFVENPCDVIIPTFNNSGGHPIIISTLFQNHILSCNLNGPNARLDRQIQQLSDNRVRRVTCNDETVHLNLNSKEVWEKFLRQS